MKTKEIPRCQQIQIEYKTNLYSLQETISSINNGDPISIDMFKKCMEFLYREGWCDCFLWDGEISGEQTRKEFFKILDIERYGRNDK
jgi:hypothetical protein